MTTSHSELERLDRGDGSIAFDVEGTGPLMLLVPGMGDLRATFRHIVPALVAAGNRVIATDLRGHGDSDASFTEYGDEPTAHDISALIEKFGGPATIVGNSMGAGSAVIVAAERPELVSSIVLIGPFVRGPKLNSLVRGIVKIVTAAPILRPLWRVWLPSLYVGAKPADQKTYLKTVAAALRRPGHARAFSRTARETHATSELALSRVRTPTLVIMGEKDPDFANPRAEAEWVAERLHGMVTMASASGHYPQSQEPELVAATITNFVRDNARRG